MPRVCWAHERGGIVKVALVLLLVLLFVAVILMALVFLTQLKLIDRVDSLEVEVRRLKPVEPITNSAQGVMRLGRTWPTPDELAAARNRIDQTGLAHPGGAG